MKQMSLISGLRWLWQVSLGYRGRLRAIVSAGLLRVGVSLAFVWTGKRLIDIATGQATGELSPWIAATAACMAVQLLLSAAGSRLYVSAHIGLRNGLRQRLLNHILRSRWDGRERFHSGDMLNRMEEDVNVVAELVCGTLPSAAVTLAQLVGAAAFLAVLDPWLTAIILCIMPLTLLLSKVYMRRMRFLTRQVREMDSRIQSHVQENLQHRTLIATLECVPMVTDTMQALQGSLLRTALRRNTISIFSGTVVQAGFALGYLTAFSWGVWGLSRGTVTFGVLTAFLQLVSQVQRPVVELARKIPAFVNALTSVERIDELCSLPLEEQGEPVVLSGPCGIRLDNVTYAYPDGGRNVIEDFSCDFEPGSLTAILGETGSGKSTLVRLMLALLTPAKGRITLYDGQGSITASPLTRGNFVYVQQGNTLIGGTLRDNLLLGNPQATEAQMHEALRTSAADFVDELPDGLDTPCGELGQGFSEGQAQRIAIARGLLRPGSIVLLDEPTSSLDCHTERVLLRRLAGKVNGKTLIVITHKEQTAALCTRTVRLGRDGC